MTDFEELEGWLLEATAAVGDSYFRLPIAGQRDAIFRERVYML